MAGKEDSSQVEREQLVETIFSNTAKTYDHVVDVFTLGMDRLWKRNIMKFLKGARMDFQRILDLACGTGIITFKLAKMFPSAQIVGIDIMEEYLDIARQKQKGENVRFIQLGAEDLDELERLGYTRWFDLIVTSYLPKYVDLEKVISHCNKLIQKDGTIIFHDFTIPKNRILRFGWHIYLIGMNPILKTVNGWLEASKKLKNVIKDSRWIYDLPKIFEEHGFQNIEVRWQPLQIAAIVTGKKNNQ
ncbi:MAG: class I SAM-dependent methyltransferase [Candidatus Heimdallarchaeota archaeon]